MLTNIDTVDWNSLNAAQIPQLVRTLDQSETKTELYSQAFETLYELLYPHGMEENWDWGAPRRMMQNDLPHQVTPFLIEILEGKNSLDKTYNILGLLCDLCKYEDYRNWLGEDGQTEYIEWSRRLRDKVRLGLPVYQKYLTSNDEYLKDRTQNLLKWLDYK